MDDRPNAVLGQELEHGVVSAFIPHRGFGFIALDGGGKMFFYIIALLTAGHENIAEGTRVSFYRGTDRDRRTQVARFVEIDGKPVIETGFYRDKYGRMRSGDDPRKCGQKGESQPDLRPAELPPKPAQKSPAGKKHEVRVQITESGRQSAAAKSQFVESKQLPVREEEWIEIRLRKIRREKSTYAESDGVASLTVPWAVLQKAKITSQKTGDRFEARCRAGDGAAEVLEIRRL